MRRPFYDHVLQKKRHPSSWRSMASWFQSLELQHKYMHRNAQQSQLLLSLQLSFLVLIQLLTKQCAIHDALLPKKKSWGHILDKILFSDIIHLAPFYLRTGVCNIWSYPESHSARCSAGLIMFLVHTGPFHSLVPSHHTWDNKEDLNRSE